jgi:hypothetical protein
MDRGKVIRMADARRQRYLGMTEDLVKRAEIGACQPSKQAWRLADHERQVIAYALVDYAATVSPEYAFVYAQWMYEIAAKLDITERLKDYAHQLDTRDTAKVTKANGRR